MVRMTGEGPPSRDAARILIARIGALGDTLMATPVIRAVRETEPDARIDFLCSAPAAPLLRHHPDLDQVFPLRRRNLPHSLSPEKWKLAALLRERKYSRAILLESAPRYLDLLTRAGITRISGFHTVPSDPGIHSAANNLRAAGFNDWESRQIHSDLHCPAEVRKRVQPLLEGITRPVVGIHPGYGPIQKKQDQSARLKGWPTASFRELVGLLLEAGISVIVTGAPEDREEANRIAGGLPGGPRLRVAAGETSVLELGALINQFDAYVSVDSGPAHMAAALGTPLVVLWGPAKLHQVRPIENGGPVVVLREPVPCAPCYDTPAMKACRDNICMKQITPARVAEAVNQLLGNSAGIQGS